VLEKKSRNHGNKGGGGPWMMDVSENFRKTRVSARMEIDMCHLFCKSNNDTRRVA
jgi:hypothetical protein